MARTSPAFSRAAFLLLVVACGSRTGLFSDDLTSAPVVDGGATTDAGGRDASVPPPDAAIPPIDARPPVDVDRRDCPDADALLVYTITDSYELQSFNPATGQFRTIGDISCPAGNATPFSMAVDRRGIAYILFTDERIYRVSTATGACVATGYVSGQSNYRRFGMGFASDTGGPAETLFVAGDDTQPDPNPGAGGLARISPTTFALTRVGPFVPAIQQPELTGTGDGRLFAFYSKSQLNGPPSFIGEVDTTNGQIVGERRFDTVDQGTGWAFAFWGGDFYMFHAPNDRTIVTRWRPSNDSVAQVATTPLKIVGAGVSTCAPQQ